VGEDMIKMRIKEVADILNAGYMDFLDVDKYIEGISIDSRKVSENNLFVPIKGATTNGHSYINDVINAGAIATLWNKDEPNPPTDIAVILVDDTLKALQELSCFYRNTLKVKIVGVTGSNGKTS